MEGLFEATGAQAKYGMDPHVRVIGTLEAWGGSGSCAFAATVTALLILTSLASRLRLVDVPGGRHDHVRPTPRVGGLAMVLGVMLTVFIAKPRDLDMQLLVGGAGMAFLGLLDDVYKDRFPWVVKLLLQTGVAVWFCAPFGAEEGLLACAFLIAAVNAVNFFDHANGLLALAAIPGLTLLAPDVAPIYACAALAYLIWNLTGRAFAGDAGSLFLGFTIAAGALSHGGPEARPDLARAAIALALPLADAGIVVGIRLAHGIPPWRSTPDHLSHRFLRRGMSRGLVLVTVAVVAASYYVDRVPQSFEPSLARWWIPVDLAAVVVVLGAPPWSARPAKRENAPPPVET
jgi:UDP-GlcNAc:undecaprenyl-phosphate GlcNAc-1-phosphate transferase